VTLYVILGLDHKQIRRYINRLLIFNQEYVDKYLIYADDGVEYSSGRMVMKLSIPAAATQIPNSIFFFLTLPSAPYYLTSEIDPLTWYALIPGAYQDLTMVGQTYYYIVGASGSYIQCRILASRNAVRNSLMSQLHASIEYKHLKLVFNKLIIFSKDIDSDYTTEELRQPSVAIPTYRSLQLMCTGFNECMSSLCIPVWKFSVAFGFIPCGYLWIRSLTSFALVYPFGAVNCFTMGFG